MMRGKRLTVRSGVSVLRLRGMTFISLGCQKAPTTEAPPRMTVEEADVLVTSSIYTEWTASSAAWINSAIRAQIQGYLVKQDYKEGDFVRKGQILLSY